MQRLAEALPVERAASRWIVSNDADEHVERIATYVGLDPLFESFQALEAHVRAVSAPFGPLSDVQWERLSRSVARQTPDGRWRLKYDPGIAVPFRTAASTPTSLWPVWDAIQCPTLILRGAESDLLSRDTAAQMARRGPKAKVVEIAGVGHAPTLLNPDQIGIVRDFLLQGETP